MGTLAGAQPVDPRLLLRWPDFFMTPELARLMDGRTESFYEFLESLEVPVMVDLDRSRRTRYIYLRFFQAAAQQQARALALAATATAGAPGVAGVQEVPSERQAWNSARGGAARALAQVLPAKRARSPSSAPPPAAVPGVPSGRGPACDIPPGVPGAATHGTKHFYEVMPLLSWLDWAPVLERHEESQLFYDLEAGGCHEENERWLQVWERFLCRGYNGFAGVGFDQHASDILTRKVGAMGTHPGAIQLQLMAGAEQLRCRESRVEFLASLGQRQRQRLEEIEGWLRDLGTQYVCDLRGRGVDVHTLARSQFYMTHCCRLDAVRRWAATAGFRKMPGGWTAAAASPFWRPSPDVPGVAATVLRDMLRLGLEPRW